ncbi:hypothetical protein D3C81_1532150 [compost metagenome]
MQTQQNLDMPAVLVDVTQRYDFLGIEAEAVVFQCQVQALHPGHFAETQGQFRVVRVIDLNPVTPLFLGHVAGHVGAAKRGLQRGRILRNMHQPDTHGRYKGPTFPDKVQVLHGLAQALGNFFRSFQRTVFQ